MMKENLSVEVVASLVDRFDSVIMIGGDSASFERLRHDAMRLRVVLPVILVAEDGGVAMEGRATDVGIEQYSGQLPRDAVTLDAFMTFLSERGIARPLLWMAGTEGGELVLSAWPNAMRILRVFDSVDAQVDIRSEWIDLIIVDSEASAARARTWLGERVSISVVAQVDSGAESPVDLANPIALIGTDLGVTLDLPMLRAIVHRLPRWEFHLIGGARAEADWQALLVRQNVIDHGQVDTATFSALVRSATAIVQPCLNAEPADVDSRARLARMMEAGAVAIVSPALGGEQCTLASSVDAFADNLRRAWAYANLRRPLSAEAWLRRVAQVVSTRASQMLAAPVHGRLNILMLYDDHSTFTSTVREHLESFAAYSRHSFHYMPATSTPIPSSKAFDIDLSIFDVIICHYSVRLSLPDYIQPRIAAKLQRFHGLKLLFIQDEYDTTETARGWMERLGFDVVYTCVPPAGREYVYPTHRLPRIEFRSTLTGYVPSDSGIDNHALPMEVRSMRIAYRGRQLPYHYGMLGWEKYRIGVDVKRLAEARGVPIDIEVDDSKRIYGSDWYRFLGSARATLGTESGSNVFDFDGTVRSRLEEMLAANPDAPFEKIYDELLAPLEGHVRMNQISPKIFEAARLRTALVLFEGEYSGIIRPYEHYIPLRHDYSNFNEVLAALEDIPRLQEMTERTYRDLIADGRYSYQAFVRGIDADIENRLLRGPRNRIFASPAVICDDRGKVSRLPADQAAAWCLFDEVLTSATTRDQVSELIAPYVPTRKERLYSITKSVRSQLGRALIDVRQSRVSGVVLRRLWRLIPSRLRGLVVRLIWG